MKPTDKDPLDALIEKAEVSPFSATADQFAAPPVGYATPIPEACPDNMVCLRGPCRFYVEITQRMKHGNTAGTFKPSEEPIHVTRWCALFPADPTDLTDETVWDCSHWEPEDPVKLAERERVRDQWGKKNGRPWNQREYFKQKEDKE